jgi:hypothetical protein
MTWETGQSGNPNGRFRGEKFFTDALRLAVNQDDGAGFRKIRRIAEKLVEQAMAGEGWAIQQVADRLDGKPAQDTALKFENRDASDWTRAELLAILDELEG